jgi:5'-nucleotidase
VQVAGLGDREMQFGRAFLVAALAKARFPVVCTNLWDLQTKKRLVKPWTIVDVGGHKVGVFGLFSKTMGEARTGDSLAVGEPVEAARGAVAELRKAGANVVVLLSSLGKTETEDLVANVAGIDVAIAGRKVPVLDNGRKVKSTMVVYGGDQGHYMGRTDIGFDAQGRPVETQAVSVALAPEIGENAGLVAIVKAFDDSFNERLRKIQSDRAAAAGAVSADSLSTPSR